MDNPMNRSACSVCGEPMPEGEEMFKFHGYSGDCPKPPKESPSLDKLEPEQIVWGDGKIGMVRFVDKADGSFGLILSKAGGSYKPGDYLPTEPEKDHMPKPGEFYLRFKNKAGLRALIYSLVDLVTEDEEVLPHG